MSSASTKSQTPSGSSNLADDRFARAAVLVSRVVIAFLWIQNVGWKTPPDFRALAAFTGLAIEHPGPPPYSALVKERDLPNIELFGWFVVVSEAAIGAFVLVGLCTRLWALIAVGQSFVIFLSVGPDAGGMAMVLLLDDGGVAVAGRRWRRSGVGPGRAPATSVADESEADQSMVGPNDMITAPITSEGRSR